jgi:glycosyltransferase involved in cell wall biosynthesis
VAHSVVRSRAPFSSRLRALLDLAAVGRMERREYPRADQVWVTSDVERRHFVRYLAPDRVIEMPNVIPVDSPVGEDAAMPVVPGDVDAVAYVGWYGYPPNEVAAIELAVKIMPRVRALGGPRRLVLIGRDPTPRMRRLARDGEVEITGEVADVLPPLRQAGLLAVPLRAGGGTRVKILEAAAAGVPVVSTRFGVEGLGLDQGGGVLLAEDPDEFARAIVRVATDPGLRSAMTLQARAALVQSHSPARLAEAMSTALARLEFR